MHSQIDRIAHLLWLGRYSKNNNMALFYSGYFDASYPGSLAVAHPVITVAGAIAPVKKWVRFERDWNAVLQQEKVTGFHATDFSASKGEYKEWRRDKPRRTNFMRQLNAIIKANINRFFMVSVELQAWEEVNSEYLLTETFHSPYAMAGFTALVQARKWAKGKKIKTPIEYIFEDGDDGWMGLRTLANKHHFEPIALPKSKAIPCQVGDLLAWKNRIAATNSLKYLDNIQGKSLGEVAEDLGSIYAELTSLDRALIIPGPNGIYSVNALRETCRKSRIAKR
jgi:hypothetical protein